jgi:lipid A 3-O-deacylase
MIRAAGCAAALVLSAAVAAHAQPAPSPGSIWTIQGENDSVSTTPGGSDKNYTSGLRLGWTSGADQGPDAAAELARTVWGDGVTRISFDINQQIYTPTDTALTHPNPRDRPVAAYLGGTISVLQDTANSRSVLALTLGVIGPSALGRQVQNGFHELIHEHINKGWGAQLPDSPAVELVAERTWRVPLVQIGKAETDILPSLTAGVGIVRDYAQAGAILRFGEGLDTDFGVARIRPGVTGGDAYAEAVGVPWYVFVGADGQLVARDAFLDGDLWRRSAHVQHNWLLGEVEAGFAVIWHGTRLSYTQTWQTHAFKGQKGGFFNFGSLTASVRF